MAFWVDDFPKNGILKMMIFRTSRLVGYVIRSLEGILVAGYPLQSQHLQPTGPFLLEDGPEIRDVPVIFGEEIEYGISPPNLY